MRYRLFVPYCLLPIASMPIACSVPVAWPTASDSCSLRYTKK
ncbi:hypothetical protein [Moorena sp. SIO3H5]|nr:hypothetical protein [Moorena sp. SIO3H5]